MSLNPFADSLNNGASNFIVKNISTKKVINIFGIKIAPGYSYNLMNIEGVTEVDIKVSLLKGVLKRKLNINEISIISTDIDLSTLNDTQLSFLSTNLVSYGTLSSAGSFKTIYPNGDGSDDSTNIQATLNTYAGKTPIILSSTNKQGNYSSFRINNSITIPSNSVIIGESKTSIVSYVNPALSAWSCVPFVAVATFGNYNSTTSAIFNPDTTLTPTKVTATSVVGLSIGSGLLISDTLHVFYATVTNIVGNVITLDRPIPRYFPSGATLRDATWPKNIKWYGNGMTISGTGLQAFEISGAENCLLDSINFTGSGWTNEIAVFDTGSFNSEMRNLIGNVTNCLIGFSTESGENIKFTKLSCQGTTGQGIWICDGIDIVVEDSTCQQCAAGLVVSDQNTPASFGSKRVIIRGGEYSYNTGIGIELRQFSTECIVDSVKTFRNGSYGISVTGSSTINNIINNHRSFYNTDSGIYVDATNTMISNSYCGNNSQNGLSLSATSSGTMLSNLQLNSNTFDGLSVSAGSTKNKASSINASSNGRIGFNIFGNIDCIDISGTENTSGSVRIDTASIFSCDGFRFYKTDATGFYFFDIYSTSKTYIRRGTIEVGNAQGVCFAQHSTGELVIDNARTVAGSIGFYGVDADSCIRVGDGVDFSSCALPYYSDTTVRKTFGSVVANGATPVAVVYKKITANDTVLLIRNVDGGTPGKMPKITITVGTGFSITADVLDTSTYMWKII